MDDVAANPIIIAFMFLLRCLVPLLIMLGVSYLLRRFGWIKEPPAPPRENDNGGTPNGNTEEGGLEND